MGYYATNILGYAPQPESAEEEQRRLINASVQQGQQMENARQAQQQAAQQAAQIQQIAASLPLYDTTGLDLGRRIVNAKMGYAGAADDATRQAYADIADGVRQYAAKNNIDLSEYGNNVNLAQAQNNLSLATEAARRQYMNMETPDELYTRRKNELMKGGLNEKKAMDQAAREYQEYRARYLHAGKNLFYDQGTTNNAINNIGSYALASLLDGNPAEAQLYTSLYAHPVDNYNLDAWTQKALTTADLADRHAVLRNNLGIQAANNNFNNQRILNDEQFARALQKMGFQNQLTQENLAAQRLGQLQSIQDLATVYKQYNPEATDAEAFAFAVSGLGGSKNGSGGGKKGNGLDGKIEAALGRYEEQEAKVTRLLKMGDQANKYDVRKAIYELEDSISTIEAAEGGKDTAKNLRKIADQYKGTFEKTYGEEFY